MSDAAASSALRLTYREACEQALRQALIEDPRVFLMGEDIGRYGGCYAVTKGMLEEFGEERIRDTPLAESAIVGAGIGAAMVGMRPIVEVMTCNFSLLGLDQIVNNRGHDSAYVRRAVRRPDDYPHGDRRRTARRRRNIRILSKDGSRISPGFASSRRRRSKTRASCFSARSAIPTRR